MHHPMQYSGRWIHRVLLAALMFGVGATAAPETKTEMSVQLPPFIVESTIGPAWRYTKIPRFEILSRCNDLTTERLAQAFHRANQFLDLVLPDRFQLALDAPQALIFYDKKLWPVAEQQAVVAMLQAHSPAHPEDTATPDTPPRVRFEPIVDARLSDSVPQTKSTASHVFFNNLMLTDADMIVTFVLASAATVDPRATYLTPAYVGNLLHQRTPALPNWFTAGFLRLYDRMEFEDNTVTVKPVRWDAVVRSGGQEEGVERGNDFTRPSSQRLKARRALELGQQPLHLPQAAPGDQFRRDASAASPKDPAPEPQLRLPLAGFFGGATPAYDLDTWLTQAELFVSWGIDPANGRTAAFWTLLERAAEQPLTETVFQECLGLDFATAAREIIAYSIDHRGIRWTLSEDLARSPSMMLQDATPSQIARIKGEWERLEAHYVRMHQPDLEGHYVALARRTLRKPYDRGDRDPCLLASLGLTELEAGDQPSARIYLEEAVSGDVVRPRAYYALARLRYDHLFGRSTRNDGKFTAEQTDPILQPLLVAARQAPPLPAVYELMTHVCFNRVEPPPPEVLDALAQGVRFFPHNDDLVRQVAALHAGTGEAPRRSEWRIELSPRPPRLEPSR
jgi:hypothetical protein